MIFTAIGATMVLGAFGGYYAMRNQRSEPDVLRQCFHKAGLYIKEDMNYPTVIRRESHEDHELIEFSLPIGLNPRKLWRSLFVFRQAFGEYIDLQGHESRFILRAYNSPIAQFDYRFDDLPLDGHTLPIVAGKTRQGYCVFDLCLYPHILSAGETGSGKSVSLRVVLTTLIKAKTPDELHLYLGDMKRSEFHVFRGVQHVRALEVTPEGVIQFLEEISEEMRRRGDLLDLHEVSNASDLKQPIPSIIVCIDEVAIFKKDKKVMALLSEIAAIGRALHVFVLLSMQRPDSELLSSSLKQNLTVRFAFRHADEINSRITLGQSGAEQIKATERGKMLLKLDGLQDVQSPHLSLDKAKELLEPYKKKNTP